MRTLSAFRRRHHDRADHRGQSLVEFALVIPIMLLLTMVALDFGRVYLGYINLQNMVRIAANYAADNPDAWIGAGDATKKASYKQKIVDDAKATNCSLILDGSGNPPAPTYSDVGGNGITTDIGDTATVGVTCRFNVITPIISRIFSGGTINVSAEAAFPVKTGLVSTSGGGSGSGVAPVAAFFGLPLSGPTPLTVQFTDTSGGTPTAWSWDFTGDGVADSTLQDPVFTFTAVGLHSVTLVASNASGSSTETKTGYISVSTSPAVVDFTATPTSGAGPLTVQFTDTSTGSPTAWAWDFDNNGSTDSTVQNPSHTYTIAGTYSVKLTVTNASGTATKTIANMITVNVGTCQVPDFFNTSTANAQTTWSGRGFTTTVNFQQGGLPWTIKSQTQTVGISIPCNSPITVSKN